MKNLTINSKWIAIGIVVVIAAFLYFSKNIELSKKRKQIALLKQEILATDSVMKEREGVYSKLVNDTKKSKQIIYQISQQNILKDREIKSLKRKIKSFTKIDLEPKKQVDTVFVENNNFEAFYPNKQDYFIKHKGVLKVDSLISEWSFKPLKLNLIISETKSGMYKLTSYVPSWLEVKDLQVNAIPESFTKPDNFDFLIGVESGYHFQREEVVFELEGGFRYKKNIFSISGNTNKELKAGIKFLF